MKLSWGKESLLGCAARVGPRVEKDRKKDVLQTNGRGNHVFGEGLTIWL